QGYGASSATLGGRSESLAVATTADSAPRRLKQSAAPAESERKLVRQGTIVLAVRGEEERAKVRDAAAEAARALGGFIASAGNDHVVLRVPSDRLEDAFSQLSSVGKVVRREL